MKIGIIGAGITGLTIGFRLAQKGHSVTIWESSSETGGLASGFKEPEWEWSLEKHYHHIFTNDKTVQKLATELNLSISFYHPQTSIQYQNNTYPFDGPLGLWKFPYLSVSSKIKSSMWLAYLKYLPYWKPLENQIAQKWIIEKMGNQAWEVLWKPLFEGKFGKQTKEVSSAWFWARIHKRTKSLGYIDKGFQLLAETLSEKIKALKGQVYLDSSVVGVQPQKNNQIKVETNSGSESYDQVVVTGSSHLVDKIVDKFPLEYHEKLNKLKNTGVVNLVLALKKQFLTDNTYWLSINQSETPFVAVVEHTNMINSKHYNGDRILYIGNYLPSNHIYHNFNEKQLIHEFMPHLQKINHSFNQNWIRKAWVFKSSFAQPIITPHYQENLPSIKTPIPRLWWVSMQHVFPWDRGTNYAIKWGEKVAKMITQSQGN